MTQQEALQQAIDNAPTPEAAVALQAIYDDLFSSAVQTDSGNQTPPHPGGG